MNMASPPKTCMKVENTIIPWLKCWYLGQKSYFVWNIHSGSGADKEVLCVLLCYMMKMAETVFLPDPDCCRGCRRLRDAGWIIWRMGPVLFSCSCSAAGCISWIADWKNTAAVIRCVGFCRFQDGFRRFQRRGEKRKPVPAEKKNRENKIKYSCAGLINQTAESMSCSGFLFFQSGSLSDNFSSVKTVYNIHRFFLKINPQTGRRKSFRKIPSKDGFWHNCDGKRHFFLLGVSVFYIQRELF